MPRRVAPNLGHGAPLDEFASRYPDLEVFTFDEDGPVDLDPRDLHEHGVGQYATVISLEYE